MRRTTSALSVVAVLALGTPALAAASAQAGPVPTRVGETSAAVARLTVTPATRKIAYGTGWQLKATARSATGASTDVSSKATWRSAKPVLAKVSARGLVTATKRKKAGKVTIKATYGGKVASSRITVSTAALRSITGVPTTSTLAVGSSLSLQPIGRFVGFSQALQPWATYSASPTGIVSVSKGTVTALTPGTTTVRTTFRSTSVITRVTVSPPAVSRLTIGAASGTPTDNDHDSLLDAGDVLPWSFTVTNTGATTLSSVSVTPTLGGPATCPAGTVAPGGAVTCTAQRTVTLADVAAGSITNQASASATGPAGQVTSDTPAQVTTTFDRMNVALQHGLPNIVSYAELVDAAKAKLAAHVNLGLSLVPAQPMSWNPGSQIYAGKGVTSYATGSQQVIVTSNKNYVGSGTGTATLGLAGTAPGATTRMAYFSANPFTSAGTSPPNGTVATVTDPGMSAFDVNLLSWLLRTDAATSTAHVALVNMRGGTASGLEGGTRTWFKAHAPSLALNAAECDLPTTTCLTGADLVIVGGDDNGGNTTTIANQVKAAYDAGVPVLFMGDYWDDYSADAIAAAFSMTVDDGEVYWDQRGLLNSTPDVQFPNGQDAYQRLVAPLVSTTFDTPLAVGDYQECIVYQANNGLTSQPFTSCGLGTAAFQTYRSAVNSWRTAIANADKSGVSWFSMPRNNDMDVYRALLLVADKLRTGAGPSLRPGDTAVAVSYPVPTLTDGAALTKAMFVDATTMTSWAGNQAAAKTGTLYCTRSDLLANACTAPGWPHQGAHAVTLKATGGDEWQATGMDAVPGSPVTVRLTSDPGVAVYVRTFYQRSGGTRSAYTDSLNRSLYDRPQFAATDWVPVTTSPTTISSPYGGPLYIRIVGSAAKSGTAVPLAFTNASTHPAVLDMTDSAQIQEFVNTINDGAYYADLAGNGFQAHLPVPFIRRALTDPNSESSNGRKVDYRLHGGLQQFLADYRDQYVFSIYKLAGLQIGTQPLDATLDPDVKTVCQNLGFPCLDASLNQRTQIQHVNYDLNATCGSLCSGNPIDSSGPPVTFGWGESHELGHNLQRGQLNVSWANTGANGSNPGAADLWTNYSNRSGEVSNNIFPYHTAWNFFRVVHPGWGIGTEASVPNDTGNLNRDTGGVDAFSIAQSIRSAQTTGGHLAAYDSRCVSHTTDALTTPTNIAIANAIWSKSGTYDDNELRMSFYQQIPVLLQGKQMADGTVLNDGYGIWTLLYQAARGWSDATSSQAKWTPAAQATYGMSDFPWNGLDSVYGSGKTVASMIGNDWLLIMLSKITGEDWRPYFQMHGVLYTSRANQQVIDNAGPAGLVSLGATIAALGAQLPYKDMSNIDTVDMTLPTTAWPGAYESNPATKSKAGFHPSSCP